MKKKELTKEERVSKEKRRLAKFYKDMEPSKKAIAQALIERAAFMRIECEDLEKYLGENGWTAPFRQSPDVEPYDRARPQGQAYQTLNANYQKIIKQLDGMLPMVVEVPKDDAFEEFVNGRDD